MESPVENHRESSADNEILGSQPSFGLLAPDLNMNRDVPRSESSVLSELSEELSEPSDGFQDDLANEDEKADGFDSPTRMMRLEQLQHRIDVAIQETRDTQDDLQTRSNSTYFMFPANPVPEMSLDLLDGNLQSVREVQVFSGSTAAHGSQANRVDFVEGLDTDSLVPESRGSIGIIPLPKDDDFALPALNADRFEASEANPQEHIASLEVQNLKLAEMVSLKSQELIQVQKAYVAQQHQIDDLQEELKQSTEDNNHYIQDNSIMKLEILNLSKKLEEMSSSMDGNQPDESQSRADVLQDSLGNHQVQSLFILDHIPRLSQDLGLDLKNDDQLSVGNDGIEFPKILESDIVQQMKAQIVYLKERFQAKLSSSERELAIKDFEIQDLVEMNEELESRVASLNEIVCELESSWDVLVGYVSKLRRDLIYSKKLQQAKQDEAVFLTSLMKQSDRTWSEATQERIQGLTEEVSRLRMQIELQREEDEELDSRIHLYQASIARLNAEVETMKGEINRLTQELAWKNVDDRCPPSMSQESPYHEDYKGSNPSEETNESTKYDRLDEPLQDLGDSSAEVFKSPYIANVENTNQHVSGSFQSGSKLTKEKDDQAVLFKWIEEVHRLRLVVDDRDAEIMRQRIAMKNLKVDFDMERESYQEEVNKLKANLVSMESSAASQGHGLTYPTRPYASMSTLHRLPTSNLGPASTIYGASVMANDASGVKAASGFLLDGWDVALNHQREIDVLTNKLSQMTKEKEGLLFDKKHLSHQLQKSEGELSILKEEVENISCQLTTSRTTEFEQNLSFEKLLKSHNQLVSEYEFQSELISKLRRESATFEKDGLSLKKMFQDKSIKLESFERACVELSDKVDELEIALRKEKQLTDQLRDQNSNLGSEIQELIQNIQTLESIESTLLTELGETKIALREQEEKHDILLEAYETAEGKINIYQETVDELNTKCHNLGHQVKQLQSEIELASKLVEDLQFSLEKLQTEYSSLKVSKEAQTKLYEAEKSITLQLREGLESCQSEYQRALTELDDLSAKHAKTVDELNNARQEISTLRSEKAILGTEAGDASTKLLTTRQELITANGQIRELQIAQALLEVQRREQADHLSNQTKIIGDLTVQLEAKTDQTSRLERDKNGLVKMQSLMSAELEDLKQNLQLTSEQLSATLKLNQSLNISVESQKHSYDEVKQSRDELALFLQEARVKIQNLEEKLTDTVASFQENIGHLEADISIKTARMRAQEATIQSLYKYLQLDEKYLDEIEIRPFIQLSLSMAEDWVQDAYPSDVERSQASDIEEKISHISQLWKKYIFALTYERETIIKLFVTALRDIQSVLASLESSALILGGQSSPSGSWKQNPIVRGLALPRSIPELTVKVMEEIHKIARKRQAFSDEKLELETNVEQLSTVLREERSQIVSKQQELDSLHQTYSTTCEKLMVSEKQILSLQAELGDSKSQVQTLLQENEMLMMAEQRHSQLQMLWDEERGSLMNELRSVKELVIHPRDIKSQDLILSRGAEESRRLWEDERASLKREIDDLKSLLYSRERTHRSVSSQPTTEQDFFITNPVSPIGKSYLDKEKHPVSTTHLETELRGEVKRLTSELNALRLEQQSFPANKSAWSFENPNQTELYSYGKQKADQYEQQKPTKTLALDIELLNELQEKKSQIHIFQNALRKLVSTLPGIAIQSIDHSQVDSIVELLLNFMQELRTDVSKADQETRRMKACLYRVGLAQRSLIFQKTYLMSFFERDEESPAWDSVILPSESSQQLLFTRIQEPSKQKRLKTYVLGILFTIRTRIVTLASKKLLEGVDHYDPINLVVEELHRKLALMATQLQNFKRQMRDLEMENNAQSLEILSAEHRVSQGHSQVLSREIEQRTMLEAKIKKMELSLASNEVLMNSLRKQLADNAKTIASLREENRILGEFYERGTREIPEPSNSIRTRIESDRPFIPLGAKSPSTPVRLSATRVDLASIVGNTTRPLDVNLYAPRLQPYQTPDRDTPSRSSPHTRNVPQ
eukprot:TRINITY_DN2308_c0_g1_i4.p1 TRINITY_DN2308_c0_g1~~TRINITY_DN2308_c0_g1_i4.p1  ORF type:complete len:2013 (-),score=413.92 TRINITY_DN2308_c0_g1_i4:39-6077(-)